MIRRAAPYLLAIACVVATLGVLQGAHLEIFACERDDFIYGAGRGGYGMQNQEKALCSLRYFTDDEYRKYNAKILPAGKLVLAGVGFALPLLLGFLAGRALARRAPRARSEAQ